MIFQFVVLRVFALLDGFISIHLHSREDFKRYIYPAIEGAKEVEVASFDGSQGIILASISLLLAICGVVAGIRFFLKRPTNSEDEPLTVLGPILPLSNNAFYVNNGVATLVSGAGTKLANSLSFFVDNKVIDGASSSLANSISRFGSPLRRIQAGFVRRYVLIFAASVFVLVALAVLGANS